MTAAEELSQEAKASGAGGSRKDRPHIVRLAVANGVATVSLDSPRNRNALSRQLVDELTQHMQWAATSDDVRVIVLTHTGNTFCAGADMAEAVEHGMERATRALLALLRLVIELPKPVIAVVHGHVRAGGVGIIGACDLAVASDESTFAFSESLLGLAPAIISLTTRTRLTDRDAARKYLTGATFDGAEASRCGLITHSAPSAELTQLVSGLLAECNRVSPKACARPNGCSTRRWSNKSTDNGPELVALSARLFASDEAREGMTAFRERRPPSWAISTHN
ncbi:MAG: enoyl-CoA hydratase family protein [Nocardioidaceae bacterium]